MICQDALSSMSLAALAAHKTACCYGTSLFFFFSFLFLFCDHTKVVWFGGLGSQHTRESSPGSCNGRRLFYGVVVWAPNASQLSLLPSAEERRGEETRGEGTRAAVFAFFGRCPPFSALENSNTCGALVLAPDKSPCSRISNVLANFET